jgi:hypothetical protein
MVEILLDDFHVLKDLFNCRNIPLTGFELPNMLWKEINTAQHFTLAAAIAQPPPRQFPAVPRQFPRSAAAVAGFSPGPPRATLKTTSGVDSEFFCNSSRNNVLLYLVLFNGFFFIGVARVSCHQSKQVSRSIIPRLAFNGL